MTLTDFPMTAPLRRVPASRVPDVGTPMPDDERPALSADRGARVAVVRRPAGRIPSPVALALVGALHERFDDERREILRERRCRAQSAADGAPIAPDRRSSGAHEDPAWRVLPGSARAAVVARPRGWEEAEDRLEVGGRPASATLVDVALHVADAHARRADGPGIEVRLTGLQGRREARLWDEVLAFTERWLGLPGGTVRARIVLGCVQAATEAEEVLFELRGRAATFALGDLDALQAEAADARARTAAVQPGCGEVGPTPASVRALPERVARIRSRRYAEPVSGSVAMAS
ncbi:hypothetical protein ACPYO6_16195 [Georgenia sp. Z1344]|uniref:hypothetical protein n=1 Tax=Georgenia sp. Z1344 TaxID=3416706 RepID=UPI003CE8F39B